MNHTSAEAAHGSWGRASRGECLWLPTRATRNPRFWVDVTVKETALTYFQYLRGEQRVQGVKHTVGGFDFGS